MSWILSLKFLDLGFRILGYFAKSWVSNLGSWVLKPVHVPPLKGKPRGGAGGCYIINDFHRFHTPENLFIMQGP